jgi:hypothetical protein
MVSDMHEPNDDNENMTRLDRVRKQIDRALNRRDPLDAEREKQIELRNIFEQIAFELRYGLRDIASEESQEVNAPDLAEMVELMEFDHNLEDNSPENNEEVDAPSFAEMVELAGLDYDSKGVSPENNEGVDYLIIDDLSIVDRLIEIEYLLKQQARELKNRAINKYIVLGCIWAVGAITLFAVLHSDNCSHNMWNFKTTRPSLNSNN